MSTPALLAHLSQAWKLGPQPPPGGSSHRDGGPAAAPATAYVRKTDIASDNLIYVFQIYRITHVPGPADIFGA